MVRGTTQRDFFGKMAFRARQLTKIRLSDGCGGKPLQLRRNVSIIAISFKAILKNVRWEQTRTTILICMSTEIDNQAPDFQVRIASTGDVLDVPHGKSILDVLVEHGYRLESNCIHGLCGTCKTRYLEGEPDHRDMILNSAEKAEFMTPCVSRSKSAEIVLDLPPPQAGQAVIPEGPVAVVTASICVGCLTCVRACTYGAASINGELTGVGGIKGAATIDTKLCTGCGLCAAACPTGAIDMTRFTDQEIISQVDGFFIPGNGAEVIGGAETPNGVGPQIVAFCCPSCAPSVAEFIGDPSRSVDLKIIQMPCTGRIDNLFLIKAFENGADGVIVSGCEPGRCYHTTGNLNAEKRVRRVGDWLDDVGLTASRVRMVHLPVDGADHFGQAVHELADELRTLGPSPVRGRPSGRGQDMEREGKLLDTAG